MTPIFIPTYGREEVTSLKGFSSRLAERAILVVVTEEEGERLSTRIPTKYLVCPVQGRGIHLVRDWVVTYCREKDIDCCIMLDDDLRFRVARFEGGKKKFRPPTSNQLERYFDKVERKCLEDGVGFASFSQEFFNTSGNEWEPDKDNASTYFVNVSAIERSKASFLLPSVDDRRFILETIAAGLGVWANTFISTTKVGKPGRGGEAKVGGRGLRHEESLRYLAARYPRFVRLRESKNPAYKVNYGTDVAATFYYAALRRAVNRGEEVAVSLSDR